MLNLKIFCGVAEAESIDFVIKRNKNMCRLKIFTLDSP